MAGRWCRASAPKSHKIYPQTLSKFYVPLKALRLRFPELISSPRILVNSRCLIQYWRMSSRCNHPIIKDEWNDINPQPHLPPDLSHPSFLPFMSWPPQLFPAPSLLIPVIVVGTNIHKYFACSRDIQFSGEGGKRLNTNDDKQNASSTVNTATTSFTWNAS